jgi:hypothetical protein
VDYIEELVLTEYNRNFRDRNETIHEIEVCNDRLVMLNGNLKESNHKLAEIQNLADKYNINIKELSTKSILKEE